VREEGAGRAAAALWSGMTVGQLTLREERSRTVKASERVAQEIVHDIVLRGLQSGDRLPLEAAMVEEYGVSRTSLREALRLLEVQGLISLKPGPGGGPVVGTVEPAHLARTAALYFHLGAATYADVMRAQVQMESTCARLAAASPDRSVAMAPWLHQELPGDTQVYRELTTGFHGVIYGLAGNPVLSLLTQAVTHIVTQHVIATKDPVELRGVILDEHAALARAIADGKAETAASMMAQHFERQHEHLRRVWPGRVEQNIQWR
jgi:GntR family transcriptional regulator, transcriptional repressor for pyruvate dehydrogenase complex